MRNLRFPAVLAALTLGLGLVALAYAQGGANALLRLMRELKARTAGLVLLTATPMQVHPVEVWDLLNLLGLPPVWTADAFLGFFDDLAQPNPAPERLDRMARLFQAAERAYGTTVAEEAVRMTGLSRLKTNKVLRALRDEAGIPRRRLETAERVAALDILRAHTPIRHLISRHTRALLRRYFDAGMLSTPIAKRKVDDRFIVMTADEQELYAAVETYIAGTWNQATATERSAVGFVMTIYRRRLASSLAACSDSRSCRIGDPPISVRPSALQRVPASRRMPKPAGSRPVSGFRPPARGCGAGGHTREEP